MTIPLKARIRIETTTKAGIDEGERLVDDIEVEIAAGAVFHRAVEGATVERIDVAAALGNLTEVAGHVEHAHLRVVEQAAPIGATVGQQRRAAGQQAILDACDGRVEVERAQDCRTCLH